MIKKLHNWIEKPRTFWERQMLQFYLWILLISILAIEYAVFYTYSFIECLPLIFIILLLLYIMNINGKIGIKQQKEESK